MGRQPERSSDDERLLGLAEVARVAGVHYMTAYRWVRTGRLPARWQGGQWRVRMEDVAPVVAPSPAEPVPGRRRRSLAPRRAALARCLLAGDEAGAWLAVQTLLAGGLSADAVLLDVLAPVLAGIGDGWAAGTVSVADEHRASQVAGRVVDRLGAAFDRPGRRRRSVVVATPAGERHGLPLAMVVDLLRWTGHRVVDLGVDLPVDVVGTAVATIPDVLVVALGVTVEAALGEAAATVEAVHRHARAVPVLVGGAAVTDEAAAAALGADGWSGVDGRSLLRAIARLEGRSDAATS